MKELKEYAFLSQFIEDKGFKIKSIVDDIPQILLETGEVCYYAVHKYIEEFDKWIEVRDNIETALLEEIEKTKSNYLVQRFIIDPAESTIEFSINQKRKKH